ncbi:hypothetical protein B0H19DRAFT_656027 [Mycena capillaripes]|nr:hypothetical protein B0H19DRAFT_656027 [Mycena capillaripes]
MYGPILGAAILPCMASAVQEGLELGILTPHALYVYSIGAGRVVARAAFPLSPSTPSSASVSATSRDACTYGARGDGRGAEGIEGSDEEGGVGRGGGREIGTPCGFEAVEKMMVVTTHSPPALVVLARPSLKILHVFAAAALAVPHSPLSPASDTNRASFPPYASPGNSPPYTSTSPPNGVHSSTVNGAQSRTSHTPSPTPTSALHGRLLAFLAPSPAAPLPAPGAAPLATWGRTLGRFFSRSAPAASALAASVFSGAGSPPLAASLLSAAGGGGAAGEVSAWVRVVDLAQLLGDGTATKGRGGRGGRGIRDVHVFEAGRAPVGALAFSRDGTRLFVVRRDGLGSSVWGLRPSSVRQPTAETPAPTHLYALRRGRTGAVVESVASARDGRFVALATRRRTVHVFAVNPYGGRADVRSHLGARVRDAEGGASVTAIGIGNVNGEGEGPTEVHALVRMRLPPPPQVSQHQHAESETPSLPPPAPLAIAFVPAAASALGLRSPTSPASQASGSSTGAGGSVSGVQDVLVFDPVDGVLSLRRITLALETAHGVAAALPMSVSLPAAAGRLSMSASPPPSYLRGAAAAAAGAGGNGGEVAPGELGGKEAVVATWSLRRRRGWAEIRRAEKGGELVGDGRPVKEDWLAQAELSTFSSAPRALPRAIYLSHQFAFYTLGEDYHALIRRYQFAIGGAKIDVRREVEVSAFALGPGTGAGGEAFVEGYGSSSPRAIRRRSHVSSSFDEPLASALAGAHYRDARPPPVLPMLPNGSPASFRSSMPVRAVAGLGDGVAEGLGRLRREMRHQRKKQLARSPPARKGGDDVEASVPLEFDEEDEDFAVPPSAGGGEEVFLRVHADREDDDALSATTSRNGEESVASVSTPATSAHPLEDEQHIIDLDVDGAVEGEWHGWASEDKLAVEEAERFDDISVVGFLDEEQAAMQAEAARRKGVAATRTRTKKRRI